MKLTAAFVLVFTCFFLTVRLGAAESVTYDATLKPFGDSLTWDYTIGGAVALALSMEFGTETITASVTGDMNFAQDSKTITVRSTGASLSSNGSVTTRGTLDLDFAIPLAFWEEDGDIDIKRSMEISHLTTVKEWNESQTFNGFLLNDTTPVRLETDLLNIVNVELGAVELGSAILSTPTPLGAIAKELLTGIIKNSLDAGIVANADLSSHRSLIGKALIVNGVSITSEGQPIEFPGGDAASIQSVYEAELLYGLGVVLSADIYARLTPLGNEIWSYEKELAATNVPVIEELTFNLALTTAATAAATTTDTPAETLSGDVNGDGSVNILDLMLISSNFGQTGEHPADANGDDVVNVLDLVIVANALGRN